MGKILHNIRQYFGRECPYCGGKIENVAVNGEIQKRCSNCNKNLNRNHPRNILLYVSSIFISCYLFYSGTESSKEYLKYRIIAVITCGFVVYVVPDIILYILGNHKIYK